MGASAAWLLELGLENTAPRVKALTDVLVEGLERNGFRCHSPRGEDEWSGIVCFSHPKHSVDECAARLMERDIFAREREGLLRLAPHFYQTEDEMRRVVDALAF